MKNTHLSKKIITHPRYRTPQAIPLANYERNLFIAGLGVCSKGVLKQP